MFKALKWIESDTAYKHIVYQYKGNTFGFQMMLYCLFSKQFHGNGQIDTTNSLPTCLLEMDSQSPSQGFSRPSERRKYFN